MDRVVLSVQWLVGGKKNKIKIKIKEKMSLVVIEEPKPDTAGFDHTFAVWTHVSVLLMLGRGPHTNGALP